MNRMGYADALRAIAILAVIIHHVAKLAGFRISGMTHELTFLGTWGVDCFFVLTGFLLSGPFLRAVVDEAKMPSFKLFWRRLFLRIYSLYAVCLLLSVADLAFGGAAPSFGDILTHATFTHNFFPNYMPSINGPLWTMALDAQFYLVLPLFAFVFVGALRRLNRLQRIRAVWIAIGSAIVLSLLERCIVTAVLLRDPMTTYDTISFWTRNLPGMASEFAIGIGIAFASMVAPIPRLGGRSSVAILAAMAGLAILSAKFEMIDLRHVRETLAIVTTRDFVGGCAAALLLFLFLTVDSPVLARIVGSSWTRTAAALAYGVYLFHYPILQHVIAAYSGRIGSTIVTIVLGTVALAISVGLAAILHVFIERPFLSLRDRARESVVFVTREEAA